MISLKNNKEIQTLYGEMEKAVKKAGFNINELRVFTTLVGTEYPVEPKSGILYYGRATNGWDDDNHEDLDTILYEQTKRPFFNLLYYFAWNSYQESWNKKVAWSNICKIAPDGGNPSDSLWDAQKDILPAIIKKEVELLSPEIIVLVTGNTAVNYYEPWHSPFFIAFPELKKIKSIKWAESRGKDCTATLYTDSNIKVILTDRPEARPIQEHADALQDLLQYK